MTTIEEMISDILRREGGYVDHPADRGGPTKYGVTLATYGRWLGRAATSADVQAMTEDEAREIYARDYYHAPRLGLLPEDIQPLAFDCAINHGPRNAIKLVQRTLNKAGFGPCDVDGACGPDTAHRARAALSAMGGLFVNAIVHERVALYEAIVARDPSQAVFLRGWRVRAFEFLSPEVM